MNNRIRLGIGVVFSVLLVIPIILCAIPAYADGPFAYPGPFGPYEEDIVTVACGQLLPVYGNNEATIGKMEMMIEEAAGLGVKIMVFPEMTLGVCKFRDETCSREGIAETLPGPISSEIEKLTKKYSMWVVYGFIEKDASDATKLYNSAAIIGPDGVIGSYKKMFPTRVEEVIRGRQPVAFDTPWGPVGIGICFDNYQFPELARTYALMGCRLLLNPTAITVGAGSPPTMVNGLYCRAAENFMFVASANRVGSRGYIDDAGQSLIVGPKKMCYEQIHYALASEDKEEVIVATIDLRYSDEMRELGCQFQEAPLQGEPLFLPEMWVDLWGGASQDELAAKEDELTTKTNELEEAQKENSRLTQNFYIAATVAGVLLLGCIGLGLALAVKKRK